MILKKEQGHWKYMYNASVVKHIMLRKLPYLSHLHIFQITLVLIGELEMKHCCIKDDFLGREKVNQRKHLSATE